MVQELAEDAKELKLNQKGQRELNSSSYYGREVENVIDSLLASMQNLTVLAF